MAIAKRNIYNTWWYEEGKGIVDKYVVADDKAMAIRKTLRKWGKQIKGDPAGMRFVGGRGGVGARLLIRKGKPLPYGIKIDLK